MKAKDIALAYSTLWFKMREQLQKDYEHTLEMAVGYACGGAIDEILPKERADEFRKELDHYEFMQKYLEFCERKYLPEETDK